MRQPTRNLVVFMAVCLLVMTASAFAQTTTTTETKTFEVISVDGSKLVLKGVEGTKEFTVPADFRFTVDGKQVTVAELRPGMKGSAVITTTTTSKPVYVTEVKNGEVLKVHGGGVIVRTADGIRSFTQGDVDKRNVSIVREGKAVMLSDLRVGDRLSANIVTEGPPQVVSERDVQASASSPAAVGSATSTTTSASAPATTAAASEGLPTTASPMPLVGLLGSASLAIGWALAYRRRRQ